MTYPVIRYVTALLPDKGLTPRLKTVGENAKILLALLLRIAGYLWIPLRWMKNYIITSQSFFQFYKRVIFCILLLAMPYFVLFNNSSSGSRTTETYNFEPTDEEMELAASVMAGMDNLTVVYNKNSKDKGS